VQQGCSIGAPAHALSVIEGSRRLYKASIFLALGFGHIFFNEEDVLWTAVACYRFECRSLLLRCLYRQLQLYRAGSPNPIANSALSCISAFIRGQKTKNLPRFLSAEGLSLKLERISKVRRKA
jgi:hypothetical protein